MNFPDRKKEETLLKVFQKYPAGATISELAARTKMNRNLIAKYLQHLVTAGRLEMKSVGSARVYSLSSRVPLSALIDYSSDLVFLLDTDNRILRTSEQVSALVEGNPGLLAGHRIEEVHHPFVQNLCRYTLPDSGSRDFRKEREIVLPVRDGPHQFTMKRIPVVFDDGTPGRAFILHDITSEKRFQEARQISEARQEGMVQDQTEFVIRFRPDGSLKFINPAFGIFMKMTTEQSGSRTFRSLVILEDQHSLDQALLSLTKDTPVTTISCRMIGPSGQVRYLDWTLRALFDETGNLHEFQGVGRDCTDRHDVQEKVNQLIADQTYLYWKSTEFVDLPSAANIYETIGRGVREMYPDAVVAVNSLEATDAIHRLTTRCFLGDHDREVFSKYLGEDVVGMVMTAPDTMETAHVLQNVLGKKLIKVPGDLSVMMMGQVPWETCRKIEEELNIGDMYILGLVSQNEILGNICLFLRKGDILRRNELLEIFIRQATVGLKCRLAEEALKRKEPVSSQVSSDITAGAGCNSKR